MMNEDVKRKLEYKTKVTSYKLIEDAFIDKVYEDPTGFVDTNKIIRELGKKYNLSPTEVENIVHLQFIIAKRLMTSNSYPVIKFKYLGKFFVTKGRRYYLTLINQVKKGGIDE
jgi:hypothetical protein